MHLNAPKGQMKKETLSKPHLAILFTTFLPQHLFKAQNTAPYPPHNGSETVYSSVSAVLLLCLHLRLLMFYWIGYWSSTGSDDWNQCRTSRKLIFVPHWAFSSISDAPLGGHLRLCYTCREMAALLFKAVDWWRNGLKETLTEWIDFQLTFKVNEAVNGFS